LGIEVVHQEVVEHHLAEHLHLSDSAVHRLLEGNASLWERWRINPERMSRYTASEVLELAGRGNVLIRGWGAAQLLFDVAHVIRVRICAPMKKRVAVMSERLGITDERAIRREIERSDDAHSWGVQRQFNVDWRDSEHYHIVLNTGFVSVKTCVSLIQQLAVTAAYMETEGSRRVLADKLIQAEVRKILGVHAADTPFGTAINVGISSGKVTLSGIISGDGDLRKAIESIEKIEGVTEIENRILAAPAQFDV
jgi:cytidylate kinase